MLVVNYKMTKYRKYFLEMTEKYKKEFEEFQKVHDLYKANPKEWSGKFNELGKPIVEIIREWEGRLCTSIEGGKNAVYSMNLAEKFKEEIKKTFSHIDMVGVKITFK